MKYGTSLKASLAVLLCAAFLLPAMAQVRDHTKIKYPPLPEFNVPKPEIYTLDNGMKVFLVEDRELPLISVSVRIRTGSNHDPAGKAGLADIFGEVLRNGGTTSMSSDQVDEFLASRAASIETGMLGDVGTASMNCLAEDFDEVFDLFAEILRRPALSEEKLDLAKVQVRSLISRRNDDMGEIAGREFTRLIYGSDSPVASVPEYATVAAVTRDDLVAWHQRFHHPNAVLLGIVGDFDTDAMKEKIESVFGDWERGPETVLPEIPYRREPNPGTWLVEKSDVTQADIKVGHLGTTVDNPDYYAIQVMNEIFGVGFASRLFADIRTRRGLAYSVGGGIGTGMVRPGLFQVSMQTASENVTKAVAAVREQIDGMLNVPPTDEELRNAKESILNSFVFNFASRKQVLNQQMLYAYYGLPVDFLDRERAAIEKVTREDVVRVAKKYIHPDRLSLLVVGRSADFDRPLGDPGEVAVLDITIPPPPDTRPEVERTEAGLEAGRKIFLRAVASLGGDDPRKLAAIRSESRMTVKMQGQELPLTQASLVVYPDRFRSVLQTPMGTQTLVVAGDSGFMEAGGQVRPLPAEVVQEQLAERRRDLMHLVAFHDDPAIEALGAGEDESGGEKCDVVAVRWHETETSLCVATDGRVLKQNHMGKHPLTQAPGNVELVMSDFRTVDGRTIPYRATLYVDGEETLISETRSMEPGATWEESEFDQPSQ